MLYRAVVYLLAFLGPLSPFYRSINYALTDIFGVSEQGLSKGLVPANLVGAKLFPDYCPAGLNPLLEAGGGSYSGFTSKLLVKKSDTKKKSGGASGAGVSSTRGATCE